MTDHGLHEYVVELIGKLSGTREVIVQARTAEDAITIAVLNECRGVDYNGDPIERFWKIRAL